MFAEEKKYSSEYSALTMGTFDGVHIGHQKLISKVLERADENSGKSLVLTYNNHPREVLRKINHPYLLTEKGRKESLIRELGIDEVAFLQFDYELSLISAEDFLDRYLYRKFRPKEIVFGYDCHFGHLRKGDYHFLERNSKKYGFKTLLIEPVKVCGKIVSSGYIRELIRKGAVEKAALMLGRYYDMQGVVIGGKRIGREIGFPTVNIKATDEMKLIPAKGVYLGRTFIDGEKYYCLTNVGHAPTLKKNFEKQVECHLLHYSSGELYGKLLLIEFIHRIRDEIEFGSKKELVNAIMKDKEYALSWIEKSGKEF